MRTSKELLEILLKHVESKKFLPSGLCLEIYSLHGKSIINQEEFFTLESLVHENRPNVFHSKVYFFPPNIVEPRIEFIKSLIEKYV
jgi:hypothetical protein